MKPSVSAEPAQEFWGYVYFDDPDWWKGFALSQSCAEHIDGFRAAVLTLCAIDPNGPEHERMLQHIEQWSERIVNSMQWHAKKNIAVMVELARLYDQAADHVNANTFRAEYIRQYLRIKSHATRMLLKTMHDVPYEP